MNQAPYQKMKQELLGTLSVKGWPKPICARKTARRVEFGAAGVYYVGIDWAMTAYWTV